MTTDPTHYYLLVYELETSSLDVTDYGRNVAAAAAEYDRRERQYRDRPEIEVVLVGADSLETVKKTHSHYFGVSTQSLLTGLESNLAA